MRLLSLGMRRLGNAWAVAAVIGWMAVAAPAQGQIGADATRAQMTRAELESLLTQLDQVAASPAYSGALRSRAQQEAAQTRQRLRDGDFQVADRIYIKVEGEAALTDSFTVSNNRSVTLTGLGELSLEGVLRSELQDHVTRFLRKYIKEPVVSTKSFVRIAVLGGVGKPGFYTFPAELPISDVIMQAGGPSFESKLQDMRIERVTGERIWEGEPLQTAIAEGRTLDRMNLRAGDRVMLPAKGRGGERENTLRTLTILLTVPATILGLTRLF